MTTFCGKILQFLRANHANIVESIQARRILVKLNIADQRSEGKKSKNVKKNTTAGKLLLEALFPAPALFLLLPVPAFHATPCLLLLLVFFHFTPVITFRFWFFFVTSLTLSIYISLSLYKSTNILHFGYTVSGRQFPRSFLFPFSFLFFSIFSAAKHSSEDDNSEDVWLDLFLLEEDGCWLGFGGNARSPVFNARIFWLFKFLLLT